MNITLEKQPQCRAKLQVEASAEEIATQRAQVVRSFSNQAKLPGFRPGKVPAKVIEKRFAEGIAQEVEERLVNQGIQQAVEQEDLALLEVLSVNDQETQDGQFRFTAEIVLAPEFELPAYENIPVERPAIAVTEAQIDEQIDNLRERFADLQPVTDRAVEEDDLAVIDYRGSLDGQALAETLEKAPAYVAGRENHWLRVRPGQFLPGLAEGVIGQQIGEERTVSVSFGDDFPLSELHGKTVDYAVTLKEIKRPVLPEADDAFAAKLLGEGKSLDEVKTLLRGNLETQNTQAADQAVADQLVAWINENIELDLPEHFVAQETQGQAQLIVRENLGRGVTREQLESQQEELLSQAGQRARINLKTSFVLGKIAEKEQVSVSDNELLQRIAQLAQQQGEKPEKLLKDLQKSRRLPGLRQSILLEKTLSVLADKAQVTEITAEEAEAKLAEAPDARANQTGESAPETQEDAPAQS